MDSKQFSEEKLNLWSPRLERSGGNGSAVLGKSTDCRTRDVTRRLLRRDHVDNSEQLRLDSVVDAVSIAVFFDRSSGLC